MKLLILGKNGQVGHALTNLCKSRNIKHISLGKDELDLTDQNAITNWFSKNLNNNPNYSFVINAAAYTKVDKAESEPEIADKVNHLAVETLAYECKKYKIPLIHISTDYIFDGEKLTNYLEQDTPSPKNIYGLTKLHGERAIQKVLPEHIILRVSWVFGIHGNNFVKTIAKLAMQKPELKIISDQYGTPTCAENIAKNIIQICESIYKLEPSNQNSKNYWGTYHYRDHPVTNWHKFAIKIIDAAKKSNLPIITKNIIPIGTDQYPTAATRPKNCVLNVDKIYQTFNIKPIYWEGSIPAVLNQFARQLSEV